MDLYGHKLLVIFSLRAVFRPVVVMSEFVVVVLAAVFSLSMLISRTLSFGLNNTLTLVFNFIVLLYYCVILIFLLQ